MGSKNPRAIITCDYAASVQKLREDEGFVDFMPACLSIGKTDVGPVAFVHPDGLGPYADQAFSGFQVHDSAKGHPSLDACCRFVIERVKP